MRRFWQAVAWSAGLGLAGCDGAGTGVEGTARVTLQVTDAPTEAFASATIDIGWIRLIPADGDPITLTEDAGEFDLLALQNGITATLASLEVPAGRYHQLRLEVRSASLTLADGRTFADGSATHELVVPSGARSGLKVNLFDGDWTMGMPDSGRRGDGAAVRGRVRNGRNGMGSDQLVRRMGVEFVPGETIVVLDFDVSRNFVLTGPSDAPTGALFTPLIRAVVRDVAGSVAGQVTDAATGAPVGGLTVRATLVESPALEELQTAEAAAVTADDGTYTLWFLSPGTYTVSVEGSAAPAQTVVVGEGEIVTGVDFAITP
jgi:hypothetical protein